MRRRRRPGNDELNDVKSCSKNCLIDCSNNSISALTWPQVLKMIKTVKIGLDINRVAKLNTSLKWVCAQITDWNNFWEIMITTKTPPRQRLAKWCWILFKKTLQFTDLTRPRSNSWKHDSKHERLSKLSELV